MNHGGPALLLVLLLQEGHTALWLCRSLQAAVLCKEGALPPAAELGDPCVLGPSRVDDAVAEAHSALAWLSTGVPLCLVSALVLSLQCKHGGNESCRCAPDVSELRIVVPQVCALLWRSCAPARECAWLLPSFCSTRRMGA